MAKPKVEDVKEMVSALMTLVQGIERAKRRGLAGRLVTLQLIAAHKRVQPSTLSVELGLHQSTVTRQIQAFERAGLVELADNPADGRSCFVKLTKAGRAEVKRLTQIGLERFALFLKDWDAADVRAFSRLLVKLGSSMAAVNRRHRQPGT